MLTALLTAILVGPAATQQTDTVFAVPANVRVAVNGVGGQVAVRTWERNELRIGTDDGERSRVSVSRTDGRVVIQPAWRRSAPSGLDLTLTVPTGASIEIDGATTDADIDGVRGEVSVSTTQGEIMVRGGTLFVDLHTMQGDVTLVGATGRMEISTLNGRIEVRDVEGELKVGTVNGDVLLRGVRSEAVEAETTNGGIDYQGTLSARGRYTFGTHGGDVALMVPEGTSATVTVSSFSGGVESDFPITLRRTESHGKRFTFALGAGEGRIEVASFSGTIYLRRP